jgi:hypothetical protein
MSSLRIEHRRPLGLLGKAQYGLTVACYLGKKSSHFCIMMKTAVTAVLLNLAVHLESLQVKGHLQESELVMFSFFRESMHIAVAQSYCL